VNLREVLNELEIPFKEPGSHHHVTADFFGVDCPYCSPDSGRYRMGFNFRHNYASCWVCGYKPLYEVLSLISGRDARLSTLLRGLSKGKSTVTRPQGRLVIPDGVGELLPAHRRYLKSRGIDSDELVRLWGIGGIGVAPVEPQLSWRIWVPIHYRGEVVSWTTRAIGDRVKRYINASEEQEKIPAKSILYGIDHCRHAIVLVEGPFDCMRIGYGAAALMGLVYTKSQLALISRFPVRVICLDQEKQAQRIASRLCEDLACFEGQTHKVELDSKDPGSASEREIRQLRKHFLE
jgi:hypothetical protein